MTKARKAANTPDDYAADAGTITATITSGTVAASARRRTRLTGGTATLPTLTATDYFCIIACAPASGTTVTMARNGQTINGTTEDRTWTGKGGSGPVMLFTYISPGAIRAEVIGSCV